MFWVAFFYFLLEFIWTDWGTYDKLWQRIWIMTFFFLFLIYSFLPVVESKALLRNYLLHLAANKRLPCTYIRNNFDSTLTQTILFTFLLNLIVPQKNRCKCGQLRIIVFNKLRTLVRILWIWLWNWWYSNR